MNVITHHHLSAEQINDDQGPAIMLTQQDDHSEPSTVLVHPWQLRAVCEQFGIIASDPQAEKTIATLTRRLLALNQRVGHLAYWLVNQSDHEHANLDYEQEYAAATADIAAEFCAELVGTSADSAPPPMQPLQTPRPVPCKPDASTVQAALL
ncbi:MAG: hypothetical protein PHH58_10225 [Rhodoferax sp.]|nr:hypothetical protein [Rhodoferax sp.]